MAKTKKSEYQLLPVMREIFAQAVRPRPKITDWSEENICLNEAYVRPGPFRCRPWQREPIDAPMYWKEVIFLFPPQVGKSTMADMIAFYYAWLGINGVIAYDRIETVALIFQVRLRTMIEDNPILRELWDGVDDHLKSGALMLKASLWRVGSAGNAKSLSSFPAGIFIGSEVAKWETAKGDDGTGGFNPVELLKGRGGEYERTGQQKGILESTPFKIGDYMYREIYRPGTLILTAHHRCPHCKGWHTYTDSQIKLRSTPDKKPDHDPQRIRTEGEAAVYYECPMCQAEISELERVQVDPVIVWAADLIDEKHFSQTAEKILPDGTVVGDRSKYSRVCYNASKLIDPTFKFSECIARFFEALADPERMHAYQTEIMGRYYHRKSEGITSAYIEGHKADYFQHGDNALVPSGAVILTAGIDTQDKGFYYTVIGWGAMMSWWVIRQDFIECDMVRYMERKSEMFELVYQGISKRPYIRADGAPMEIYQLYIDRGGHRPEDVDYICAHWPQCDAYIGRTIIDPKQPLIEKSKNGKFWLGQTELISEYVGKMLESEGWYLPQDIGPDFCRQVIAQSFRTVTDIYGRQKQIWIHGGSDHYRDCVNMAYAAAKRMNLDKYLMDSKTTERLEETARSGGPRKQTPAPEQTPKGDRMTGSTYDRALRGGNYGGR
jgi:phage terminase large subunit GpA-like protein